MKESKNLWRTFLGNRRTWPLFTTFCKGNLTLMPNLIRYYRKWPTRAFLVGQLVKNPPAMQETWFASWVGKIHWRRNRLPTPLFLGFPDGSAGKESVCNVGDLGSILGLGRSPGEGNNTQSSILAWTIAWTIQSMGSQRVGHDWVKQSSLC